MSRRHTGLVVADSDNGYQLPFAPGFGETPWVLIDRVPVHLVSEDEALQIILQAAISHPTDPLGVASINLDHVHHFGGSRTQCDEHGRSGADSDIWLNLIDGAPVASQVRRITGSRYPKLSGSDLIEPALDQASAWGLSVALIGGSADVTASLEARFQRQWKGVKFAGHWTPDRSVLESPSESIELAHQVRAAGADIVLVCLGKPRQERWIEAYGKETGAGVLLAFGAVVDFLAGRVARAPKWISSAGVEWLWRLGREPKRLARRYLIEGPPAYIAVRTRSGRNNHPQDLNLMGAADGRITR